jgi:hypothetical protein
MADETNGEERDDAADLLHGLHSIGSGPKMQTGRSDDRNGRSPSGQRGHVRRAKPLTKGGARPYGEP